jgi:hypothetical protein
MKMRNTTLLLLLLVFTQMGYAQTDADPKYKLLTGNGFVSAKNYYLLSLIDQLPALKSLLNNDQVLLKIDTEKRNSLAQAVKNCGSNLGCYIQPLKFSAAEMTNVGGRLTELYQEDNALGALVKQHLRPSGCYSLFAGLNNKELLIKAWEQDAKAVNHTISVYAEGAKANYPKIDSISFNIKRPAYVELVALNTKLSLAETENSHLFYSAAITFALHSLEINQRLQSADEEPMATGVNKAAVDYARKLDWDKYKYTLILVPGEGPEVQGEELSAGGMLRCRLAALQYEKGVAPLIMVSGGCVHPYKTKFNEAIEMKKYLIETLHIPEKAILVEPHARHTTTNLRNCARLIFRYGLPMDKACITSTAKSQSFYITGVMTERCKAELGYMPYRNGARLSDTETEFYPLSAALQIDFDEPMDP